MSAESREPRDVVVAEYLYRHEAEFAAGFLSDAGIPHRLEADDAGGADAGVTMGRPARVWVRREDAEAARELLEITPEAMTSDSAAAGSLPAGEDESPAQGLFIDRTVPAQRDGTRLGGAERGVALALGLGLSVLAFGFEDALSGGPGGQAWVLVVLVVGLALLVSGLVGRAWGPVRAFLRAISGSAP